MKTQTQNDQAANEPSMSSEQAADLAALTSVTEEAKNAEAEKVQQAEAEKAQQAGADLAQEVSGLITMLVSALSPALPSLTTTYTPEATAAASSAIAAVCQKHGWLSGGMFGNYGEEIAAAAIIVPLGIATYKGVTADIDAAKERAKFIKMKREGDYQAHLNITRNHDGQTNLNPKAVVAGPVIMAESEGGEA